MKTVKVFIFLLFLLFFGLFIQAQTTYNWTGNGITDAFIDPNNWSPAGVPSDGDVIVFDDIGEVTVIELPGTLTSLGEFLIQNNSHVTLESLLDIGIMFDYILIDETSSLEIIQSNFYIQLFFETGDIYGTVALDSSEHKFAPASSMSLIKFYSASKFEAGFGLIGYPFDDMQMNTVEFQDGSDYYHQGGSSPFGLQDFNIAVFFPESNYYILGGDGSNIYFSGKTYGNIINDSGNDIIVAATGFAASTFSFNSMITLNGALSFEGNSFDIIEIGYLIDASGGVISLQAGTGGFIFSNYNTYIGGTSPVRFYIDGPATTFSMLMPGNTLILDTDIDIISPSGTVHHIVIGGIIDCGTNVVTLNVINLFLSDTAKLITAHPGGFEGSMPGTSYAPETTFEYNALLNQNTGFTNQNTPVGKIIVNKSAGIVLTIDNDLLIDTLYMSSGDFDISDSKLTVNGNIIYGSGVLKGNIAASVLEITVPTISDIYINTDLHLDSFIINTGAEVRLMGTGRLYTQNTVIQTGQLFIESAELDIIESLVNSGGILSGGPDAGLFIGPLVDPFDLVGDFQIGTFKYERPFAHDLSGNLIVENLLNLVDGEIFINNFKLTINGNYESQGGVLGGNNQSLLELNGTNSSGTGLTITFNEMTPRNELQSLTVNRDFEIIDINSNLYIHNSLSLTAGKLRVNDYNIFLYSTSDVSVVNTDSYIITGENGSVSSNLPAGALFSFPVGTTDYYAPVSLIPDAAGEFFIKVKDSVYVNGNYGEPLNYDDLVNLTWDINSSDMGINYDMTLSWDTGAEGSELDFSGMYLSGYDINLNEWTVPNMDSYTFSDGSLSAIGLSDYGLFMVSSHPTDLPVAGDNQVHTSLGNDYIFSLSDFNFSGSTGDEFMKLLITESVSVDAGSLYVDENGNNIVEADEEIINMSEVDSVYIYAGKFKYKPETSGITDFKFKVSNGLNYSEAEYVMIISPGTNNPPVVYDREFTIPEHSPNGTIVGKLEISDPDPGQVLLLNILEHTNSDAFDLINDCTIVVKNSELLEYSLNPDFEYNFEVCDNGVPIECTSFRVTIYLEEVHEDFKISNYISPNNDNHNDTWIIKGVDLARIDVFIFNNSGNLVYESKGYRNDWDGTSKGSRLPAGVYYYIVKTEHSEDKGTITLVR